MGRGHTLKFLAFVLAFFPTIVCAQGLPTTTTVNITDVPPSSVTWLDINSYAKPLGLVPTLPTIGINYYVDISSGTNGSGCGLTTSSPCRSLRALSATCTGSNDVNNCGTPYRGLPGLRGNSADAAAAINVRGTGWIYVFCSGGDHGIQGTLGKEVVIRPWAGQGGATFNSGSSPNGRGTFNGDSSCMHDVIFYGKDALAADPNAMALHFVSNSAGCENASPCWALAITGARIQVWYSEFAATTSTGIGWVDLLTVCNTEGGSCDGVGIYNSEFHDCRTGSNQCSAVYTGACTASGGCNVQNFEFKNNIVRNMGGEGLEINPRTNSTGFTITGNAIYNVGFATCNDGGVRLCRPAITLGINQSGSVNNVLIANNYSWNLSSGFVWEDSESSLANRARIIHNTVYDYGKGTVTNNKPQAVQAVTAGNSNALVQDNIFLAPNGTAGIGANMNGTESFNVCGSSDSSCGASKQNYSSATFLSTIENSATYLQVGSLSEARNHGTDLTSSVPSDYFGTVRPKGSAVDIGAMEYVE